MPCDSQKYKNLPKCLRCIHCVIPKQDSPIVYVTGEFGYFFVIKCTNELVDFRGDWGQKENEFFWQPSTNDVWVDGAGDVNKSEKTDCGHFTAKFIEVPCSYSESGVSFDASPEWKQILDDRFKDDLKNQLKDVTNES
jgi:hypothetical protein